ncbi:hypothetical protein JXQ70_17190 [bacterium]|nr:hypothetical protein [bacterium]
MVYFVRKITRAKWDINESLSTGEIPADGVTFDLRTQSNSLSLWQLESPSDKEIKNIAIALATAATRVDRMDLTWIEEVKLSKSGITIHKSDGRTPVESLKCNHVEIKNLDLERLCVIAKSIDEALTKNQYKRFTMKQITSIIAEAVREDIVTIDKLPDKIRELINRKLNS